MPTISRGFHGRRREGGDRLPPGQFLTDDFPVLSLGPTPQVHLDRWSLTIRSSTRLLASWDWEQFRALPHESLTRDIHCVTRWSKFDTRWRGVAVDTLLAGIDRTQEFAMAYCDDGYTTNLRLDDLTDGRAWVADEYDGQPLTSHHGGPARLLVPHLYLWKSAKWLRGLRLRETEEPGFWEQNGYHLRGDPWREERYW